jgi:hypothetical protein
LLHDTASMDWTKFDPILGLRAALFVVAPIVVGALTGNLRDGLFAALGANFLANTEGSGPGATRFPVLAAACVIEPLALAAGTLLGTLGAFAVLLVGVGVIVLLTARGNQDWTQVGLLSAVVFVVGVGLPGASVASAIERLWASMAGAFWILGGLVIERRLRGTRGEAARDAGTTELHLTHPFMVGEVLHSQAFGQAVVTGIATSVGLAVGLSLGLPRDIWIMITIIISTRQGVGPTISSTFALVTGTGIGAVIAALITLATSSLWVLVVLMTIFAFGMFSARLVSQALFQSLVTPFLIILLNIIYPGEWWLALVRIADVTIGGAIAIVSVYVLFLEVGLTQPGRRRKPDGGENAPPGGQPARFSGYMQVLLSSLGFGSLLRWSPPRREGKAQDRR